MADSIIRCDEHLKNFTLLDNTCLKTSTLSMQAMGLFAYLMTLPSNWVIYKSELVNHFANGRDAVYNAFNELIDAGFITFIEKKNEKNQFNGYEYYIHEKPVADKDKTPRKPRTKKDSDNNENKEKTENGKPHPEKPYSENPSLQSTDIQSINNKNSNSHCCGSTATNAKQKISFKNEDYTKVFNAYFTNCKTLYDKGVIENEHPVLPVYAKKIIKSAFENFGVDNVVKAVEESINHEWLAINEKYPFIKIFGPNELPNLINKTYKNAAYKNAAQKQNNFSNSQSLEDKIDLSDMAVYEEEAV